ncbi:cell envelope integrity protein CreD [Desulfoluna limicola]|uniref:Cell envelope integrity protein CreD n=1 Tax=Desulfoluna limicola TaxID=2810562 RepID=A0ABM7PKN3_9BACT|nr:cell envelope integrity protein CreD [Desulfoluna limicola]BCS97909.1 cell envelope integrity protein CreD [Desulfoluna limicola]
MKKQETFKKTGEFIRHSATVKVISIGVLVLLLLIPMSMISSLMREREYRRDDVVQEINAKWGNSQTITGPFFTVPYKSFYRDDKDALKYTLRYLHILPEHVDIHGEIDTQVRYRSLYEAVLYNTRMTISGTFTLPVLTHTSIDSIHVLWDKAVFSVGITDMRGIQDKIAIKFDGAEYKASPGLKSVDVTASGVQCAIPLSPSQTSHSFSLGLNLNGSEEVRFIPVGETTRVKLTSSWPSPSFNGAFLPTTREVTDQGFTADWTVLHLNRNFPQVWAGNQYNVSDSSFGVRLLITADVYQKSMRIAKYALMFIVFTFSAFFFSEIINKRRVHPIQYTLIGLAILLFYVLLLSISEHVNFDLAYIASATAITTLITGYSRGILRNNQFSFTVFGILVVLYSYLYIVLQLEDYALIMGSIGLLIVLTLVMFITREIDWYALDKDEDQ